MSAPASTVSRLQRASQRRSRTKNTNTQTFIKTYQLLRSGTSVGANAEEAKSADSRRDFASKTSLVLREARESSYWLRLLAATQLAPAGALQPLLSEANELVAIYTVAVRRAKQPHGELKT